ncbi:class I SAM-dependent rRNA methyltransferase [Pendulispora albinea]|uniref:Class I SAM-dependent rRNA methyltransferase n=1 Tax=Pendulispora albinea TaxID=2741071 RepID=A0ABZ2LJ79_9BACT
MKKTAPKIQHGVTNRPQAAKFRADSDSGKLEVGAGAVEKLRRGHPWVWQRTVQRGLERVQAGDDVLVVGPDGSALGRGLADPESPIAARLFTNLGQADVPIDRALFAERARSAFAIRAKLFRDGATNAYRLLHGEGDRLPGFVIDRYDDVAVLRIDGDGAHARLAELVDAVWPQLEALGVVTLLLRTPKRQARERESKAPADAGKTETLRGREPSERVSVREHGVPFVVDVLHGQKTGAFLDQRENRRRTGALAPGRRVLNLFSYAGGFSLFAALGGATHVTSVDMAAGAHAAAQASFRLAGVDPRAHAFVTADAFAFLEGAKRRGSTWDLIISDPPSFASNEKSLPRALTAYRALHRACVDVLAPGGVFCAASCSSHVDAESFLATLDDVATNRSDLRLLEHHGPPPDHPTLPAWPEGRYLKFAVLG